MIESVYKGRLNIMWKSTKLFLLLILLGFSVFVNANLLVSSVRAWTPLEGHITQDTTLTLAKSPYRVINDVTVDAGVKLTIEPGVKVEFNASSFIVYGTLNAVGTPDRLINFTAFDPKVAGWSGINFWGEKSESLTIRYSVITHAYIGINIAGWGKAVIEKSEISDNSGCAIMLNRGYNVLIKENTIKHNGNGIVGILPGTIIANNTISFNECGIYYYSFNKYGGVEIRNVTISSNTVSSNGREGIYLHIVGVGGWLQPSYPANSYFHNVTISSNTVSSNGKSGIYLCSYGSSGSYLYNVIISSNTVSSNLEDGVYINAYTHYAGLEYDLTMSRNTISANHQNGICIDGGINGVNANLSRNSIAYNQYGVLYTETKNNLAKFNDIYRNTYGMNVTNGATVNAENNFWGDSEGPYHASLNPTGKGNPVNGDGVDLDFIPFLSSPIVNERPTARLTADKTSISAGQTVAFNASASTDDVRVDKYFFDFGDGKNSDWTALSTVEHNYTSVGVYTVNLTVIDDLGVKSNNTATVTITVKPSQPQLDLTFLIYIAVVIIILITVGSGVALAKRKSHKHKQEPPSPSQC